MPDSLGNILICSCEDVDANDTLDPRTIGDWIAARQAQPVQPVAVREFAIDAALARPAGDYLRPRVTVAPLDVENGIIWIGPAGYAVARSERPVAWPEQPSSFDFELIVADATIVG